MYENKIFKRDACDEVSLLHPRHRFAKTRTRRALENNLSLTTFKLQNNETPFKFLDFDKKHTLNFPDKTIGVGFTFGLKFSAGIDFHRIANSFKYF